MDINIYLNVCSFNGFADPRVSKQVNQLTADLPYNQVRNGIVTPQSDKEQMYEFVVSVCKELYKAFHVDLETFIKPESSCLPLFNLFYQKGFHKLLKRAKHKNCGRCDWCTKEEVRHEGLVYDPDWAEACAADFKCAIIDTDDYSPDGNVVRERPTNGRRYKIAFNSARGGTDFLLPAELQDIVDELTAHWPMLKARALARTLSFVRKLEGYDDPIICFTGLTLDSDIPLGYLYWRQTRDVPAYTSIACQQDYVSPLYLISLFNVERMSDCMPEWESECVRLQNEYPENKDIVLACYHHMSSDDYWLDDGVEFIKTILTPTQLALLDDMNKNGIPSKLSLKFIGDTWRVV